MNNSKLLNSFILLLPILFPSRSIHAFIHISSQVKQHRLITNLLSKRYTYSCRHLASHRTEESDSLDNILWLSRTELEALSRELNKSPEKVASIHADVTYHGTNSNVPSHYRLNKYSTLLQSRTRDSSSMESIPQEAQEATDRIMRWCSDFVKELDLCPWTKLSLQSKNAIRIKVMQQSELGLNGMERMIREAAYELIELTDEENSVVDINTAITFVVALPDEQQRDSEGFQFENFYKFCTDLEDALFDEADEALEASSDETDEVLLGDEVTIAPFHPKWSFDAGDYASTTSKEKNPLDYEKKAPYATISLVRTSVIQRAGEEATNRIGIHNEQILQEFGVKRLKRMYDEKVLLKPLENI